MINIFHHNSPEINYVVKVVFKDYLGIKYTSEFHDKSFTEIVLENGKSLVISDDFFFRFDYSTRYISKQNIPEGVKWLINKHTKEEKIPVIFGNGNIVEEKDKIICNVDILAGIFFMLSRWEEAVIEETDAHNRFKSEDSLAVKEGFFEKPIVNQYLDFLWSMLLSLGIKEQRKTRTFRIEVSHDIDAPFMFILVPLKRVLRKVASDIIKRKSLISAIKNFIKFISVRFGALKQDPFNTFDQIMKISERYGLKSTFFFLTGGTSRKHDAGYDPGSKLIRELMVNISKRGHHIGLHGSYNSYNDEKMLGTELKDLTTILEAEKIANTKIGLRQHFLRWETPDTFQIQENVGISYDTTLGYADKPGFRAGTCYPFYAFNIKTRKELSLIERPLIVMDCTLTAPRYLNLSFDEALQKALKLKNECEKHCGVFTLLWHNTEFSYKDKALLYEQIITGK